MSERDASGHWKKGTSGNPGGRPKLVAEVRDLAQDETAASIKTLASIRDNARAPAQARVAACSALLDRGWGKPAQSTTVEVTEKFAFELPLETPSRPLKKPPDKPLRI
jgi:hypothetical protein